MELCVKCTWLYPVSGWSKYNRGNHLGHLGDSYGLFIELESAQFDVDSDLILLFSCCTDTLQRPFSHRFRFDYQYASGVFPALICWTYACRPMSVPYRLSLVSLPVELISKTLTGTSSQLAGYEGLFPESLN